MSQPITIQGCKHGFALAQCTHLDCQTRAKQLYPVRLVEPETPDRDAEDARHAMRQEAIMATLRSKVLRIATLVAAEYEMPVVDLLGTRRFQELTEPRHVIYWLCRNVGCWSFPSIGRAAGRDHTTIMSGVRVCERRMAQSEPFRARVERLVMAADGLVG